MGDKNNEKNHYSNEKEDEYLHTLRIHSSRQPILLKPALIKILNTDKKHSANCCGIF